MDQDLDVQKADLLITRSHSSERIASKRNYRRRTSQNLDQAIVLAADIPISCLPGSILSGLLGLPRQYTNGCSPLPDIDVELDSNRYFDLNDLDRLNKLN